MFGGRDNFRMENITFTMAHFDIPYNAILGRPTFVKFMAAVHYAYNTVKISGPDGVISIKADVKGSVHCAERLYKAVATTSSDNVEHPETFGPPSTKPRLSPDGHTPIRENTLMGAEPKGK